MRLTLKDKAKYRGLIEELVQTLSDEKALMAIPLFPAWHTGRIYDIDYRVKRNDTLYSCLVKHEAESEAAAPELSPELWKQI